MDAGGSIEGISSLFAIMGVTLICVAYYGSVEAFENLWRGKPGWKSTLFGCFFLLVLGYNCLRVCFLVIGWHLPDYEFFSGINLVGFASLGTLCFILFCTLQYRVDWEWCLSKRLVATWFTGYTATISLAMAAQGIIFIAWDHYNVSSHFVFAS